MKISITRKPPERYGFRIYVATVLSGPMKGQTFEREVLDCGMGAAAFERKLKAEWPNAYCV